MSDYTTPAGAVFLSYASQDAEAAKRICETLRAAGVEVWFDQDELVGGDAWDQKIRGQIGSCALFMPVISANTQARLEGYFRLEWKLAAQRTHTMADEKAFLLPVVIDATRDTEARMPGEFKAIQWTRLPNGETPPAFVARVQKLLSANVAGLAEPGPGSATPATSSSRRNLSKWWWLAPIFGMTMALALVFKERRPEPVSPAVTTPVAGSLTPAGSAESSAARAGARPEQIDADPAFASKSVAVLAFANLSDEKANEYFSDGISEELLNVLQKIPGLKVSARTSAFSFKGKNATAQEIGRTLGVANLVEGSVRKAGSQVRITARLSRADTGEQLWSESYTRDLTDVFSVQTELAQAIVVALRAKLLGETGTEVRNQVASQVSTAQQGGTTQVEAHELYLQGKYFANQPSLANIDKAVDYFQRAVDADGSFALAWAALGRTVAVQAEYFATTPQDLRERFARARRAVDRALALAPDLADGYFARIEIQASYDYDWVGARESTERILMLAPSNALFISSASQLAAQFGDLEKGIRLGRQAAELDPVNAEIRYWLGRVYQMAGRLPEAEAEFRRAAELSPSVLSVHRQQSVLFVQQGRAEAAVAEARLEGSEWSRQAALAVACWAAKDTPGADATLARLIAIAADSAGYQVAEAYAFRGEADRAFEWLERAYLNRDSGMGWLRMDPLLKNLHGDPRWTAFVRKVGLSDDQLK